MTTFAKLSRSGQARALRRAAQAAIARYELEVRRIRRIALESNATFRVETSTGECFALRVGVPGPIAHSIAEIRSEIAWLESLRDAPDVDVVVPVPNRTGDDVTVVDLAGLAEPLPCVLFEWIDGPLLDRRLTARNVERVGALAASLHRRGTRFRPPPGFAAVRYDRPFPFDEPVVLFDDQSLVPPARRAVYRAALARVEAAIARLTDSGAPMRVLHGDLHSWNVKVTGGRVVAFDFEDLMWGWPVQDIATTLYYWSGRDDFQLLRSAFRQGYETVAPWPDATGDEVDTFIIGRSLVIANDAIQLIDSLAPGETEAILLRGQERIRLYLDRTG